MQRGVSFPFLILFLASILITSCRSSRHSSSEASSTNSLSETVISTAKSYLGTRYKYGGTTKAGMDCSGLMCTTFKSININLPRTSEAQSGFGKKIPLKDVKPGDLVFFTDRKGHKKVTHVGLVTETKGDYNIRFIHSSTKSGVTESDLSVNYYKDIFLFAARVID